MAALSAWRPSDVHSVVPSDGLRQKYCPCLRSEKPNSRSPLTTGELMYMREIFVLPDGLGSPLRAVLETLTPMIGLPVPEKISVSR